jgi:hypothetical protein
LLNNKTHLIRLWLKCITRWQTRRVYTSGHEMVCEGLLVCVCVWCNGVYKTLHHSILKIHLHTIQAS